MPDDQPVIDKRRLYKVESERNVISPKLELKLAQHTPKKISHCKSLGVNATSKKLHAFTMTTTKTLYEYLILWTKNGATNLMQIPGIMSAKRMAPVERSLQSYLFVLLDVTVPFVVFVLLVGDRISWAADNIITYAKLLHNPKIQYETTTNTPKCLSQYFSSCFIFVIFFSQAIYFF